MLEDYNARLIDEHGAYMIHRLPEGDAERLNALQDAVGGFVEVHQLPGNLAVWMNEDARSKGTHRNLVAERIVKALGVELYGGILGAVVITGRSDDGETLALTPEQVATLDRHVEAGGPRPVDGPHPNRVRDARNIRYPGQLQRENLAWELTTNQMTAFYSGEDIGAYRPTDTGFEVRLGPWAPYDLGDRWLETEKTATEQQAADMVLFNFNLHLRTLPADES